MKIIKNGQLNSVEGPEAWFTGSVRIDPLFQKQDATKAAGALVTFEPGARTAWHTHPAGQTLIVESGLGWVQREGGPIEYLLVNENGKVHESLLTTKARPLHLQIVLKLLRYRSGEGALFDTFLPEEEQREKIEAGEKAPLGDAVAVTVRWEKAGETRDGPLAPWIFDAGTGAAMTDEPWIVTGSHVSGGTYLAESEGSFIGIYLDQIAILNMSRPGAENDERWGANPAETPEVGQKVAIILKPVTKPGATAQ